MGQTYAFAQANDGPQRAAQGAATADAAAKEPLDIQGQGLLQYAIDAADGRFEFLGRNSWEQATGEFHIKAIAEAESVKTKAEHYNVYPSKICVIE